MNTNEQTTVSKTETVRPISGNREDGLYMIKPLEWKNDMESATSDTSFVSPAFGNRKYYRVFQTLHGTFRAYADDDWHVVDSIERGKALCESHYEEQLKKCLIAVSQ